MNRSIRLVCLLIFVIMLLAVCACGNDKDASTDPDKTGAPAVSASPGASDSPEATAGQSASEAPGTTAGSDDPEAVTDAPVYTDVPVITASPDGEVTTGPTSTPYVTKAPSESTPAPASTDAPSQTEPGQTASVPEQTQTAPSETPDPSVPHPETPNDYTALYEGAVIDVSDLEVGDTFFWTLSLNNENSSLFAGLWLVEFPSKYLTPVSSTDLWEGSLKYIIDEAYDNGEPDSDHPEFMFNIDYEGQTGANPYGESGKRYTLIGMYVTSFDHCGVQARGPMIRIKYRIERIPSHSSMMHDKDGYYIPLKVLVHSSTAMTESGQTVTHGIIKAIDGKIYFGH